MWSWHTHWTSSVAASAEGFDRRAALISKSSWTSFRVSVQRQFLLLSSNVIFAELCKRRDLKGLKCWCPVPYPSAPVNFSRLHPFSVTASLRNEACPSPRLLGGRSLNDPYEWASTALQTPPEPSLVMQRQSDLKQRIFSFSSQVSGFSS